MGIHRHAKPKFETTSKMKIFVQILLLAAMLESSAANAVTKCAAGSKFIPKNGAAAAKCEACGTGTFNAKDDASTTCAAHNKCTSTSVKTAGDATKDAVCNAATGAVTKCAAGKKFVAKNGNVAAKCEACATGKFNAKMTRVRHVLITT